MLIIIHDDNYDQHAFAPGVTGYIPRVTAIGSDPDMPLFSENFQLIPEDRWKAGVDEMEAAKSFARYRYEAQNPIPKNQGQMPYCWAFSLTQGVEIARAVAGHSYIELAPESLGGVTGWRSAGWYCDSAIKWATEHGIASRPFVPDHSITPSQYKAGWEADAKFHAPIERYDLGVNMWAEVVTALLAGFAVYCGYTWWSHAVILDQLIYQGSELCVSGPNSWGPNQRYILKGSRKLPSEAFVIRSVTYSDK